MGTLIKKGLTAIMFALFITTCLIMAWLVNKAMGIAVGALIVGTPAFILSPTLRGFVLKGIQARFLRLKGWFSSPEGQKVTSGAEQAIVSGGTFIYESWCTLTSEASKEAIRNAWADVKADYEANMGCNKDDCGNIRSACTCDDEDEVVEPKPEPVQTADRDAKVYPAVQAVVDQVTGRKERKHRVGDIVTICITKATGSHHWGTEIDSDARFMIKEKAFGEGLTTELGDVVKIRVVEAQALGSCIGVLLDPEFNNGCSECWVSPCECVTEAFDPKVNPTTPCPDCNEFPCECTMDTIAARHTSFDNLPVLVPEVINPHAVNSHEELADMYMVGETVSMVVTQSLSHVMTGKVTQGKWSFRVYLKERMPKGEDMINFGDEIEVRLTRRNSSAEFQAELIKDADLAN